MHQTTVRFGSDLWEALSLEADRLGVSIAQFVRDAALVRLSHEQLRSKATSAPAVWPPDTDNDRLAQLRARVDNEAESTAAVRAQARAARTRAQRLRKEAERLREQWHRD